MTSWEAYLAACFPAYLLPEAARSALPEEEAARFLARLGASPGQLAVLRAASVAAAHAESIIAFTTRHLPAICRAPAARVEVERRPPAGDLRGHLDVPATLARWAAGRRAEVVARAPRRATPLEMVLLKATVGRLVDLLGALRAEGLLRGSGWGAALAPCEEVLRHALAAPPLRDLPDGPIDERHERAARGARHPGHALSARLWRAIRDGLDARDPAAVARALAEGALAPLADHTRFELAVLIRLLEALWERLRRRGFDFHQRAILSGRREIAEMADTGGTRVRVYYDQAPLAPGPYHAGLQRYLAQRGRLRPDLTLITSAPGRADRAVLIEAKLSADPDYLAQGYREAHLYRAEYGSALGGWPQVILVSSGPIAAAPSREDVVIAVGWDAWVPEDVVEGLLEGT